MARGGPGLTRIFIPRIGVIGSNSKVRSQGSCAELRQVFDAMVNARMQVITVNREGLVYQQRVEVAKMTV
jgi:hypothetical protein